jgi:hypothetical protein
LSLVDEAQRLANDLTDTLNGSICDNAHLEAKTSGNRFFLGQMPETPPEDRPIEALRGDFIPIAGHEDQLFLRAHWRFGASSSGRYLKTEWSEFGLFVWTKDPTNPAPVIRLEVDATRDPDAWHVAHLQVHGESHTLGQVWGARQEPPRALQDLHLPVGGFRYRPCLEDFIEFLIEEHLVPGKPTWKAAIERTRVEYRRTQLSALISKNLEAAKAAIAEAEEDGAN